MAHPASYSIVTGSFPRVQQPGRGKDHPPPSSADIKARVQLYICATSVPSWHITGQTLPFLFSVRSRDSSVDIVTRLGVVQSVVLIGVVERDHWRDPGVDGRII
jgi:hypothetical protein